MGKTVAGKLLSAIWETFKELFPSFIDKTYRKIEPELRKEISWITQIVSKINDVLQSPVTDVITALIPGDADDDFVEWARRVLPALIGSVDPLTNEGKALISAKLVMDRTDMELSQALITSQVVYKKENG
jgi:hypothetical protein